MREHRVTHPVIGIATWQQIQKARDERGKVCSWCFEPVSAGRRTRCGKRECDEAIWRAYSWARCQKLCLRKNRKCALCSQPALEVDHIIPVSLGGTGDEENLRSLCLACHRLETNRLRKHKDNYVAMGVYA